jgi:hypothetical protein
MINSYTTRRGRRKLIGMTLSSLRLVALAGMVALLVGIVPSAQLAEAGQSIEVIRTRANAGDAHAQGLLGWSYANGLGVPLNDVEAAAWYRKAAEQGNAGAQVELGLMYGRGRGVPQDYVEAYKWLNLAMAYADAEDQELYAEARDDAAKRLTPEQRADAQRRAREFFEAHPPE